MFPISSWCYGFLDKRATPCFHNLLLSCFDEKWLLSQKEKRITHNLCKLECLYKYSISFSSKSFEVCCFDVLWPNPVAEPCRHIKYHKALLDTQWVSSASRKACPTPRHCNPPDSHGRGWVSHLVAQEWGRAFQRPGGGKLLRAAWFWAS